MKEEYRIGSRESQLAMIQSLQVQAILQKANPTRQFPITGMTTVGDQIQDVSLNKIGQKSLFTKELEVALDAQVVDLVVHSLKDLPTTLPAGMFLGAIMKREDPRDSVIMSEKNKGKLLSSLPNGSVIGTSSVRRIAQLTRSYPHLKFLDVRGNLNTRLRKLDDPASPYDALILAYAGVFRMGWSSRISETLNNEVILHAVGQGALGIECREGDAETLELVSTLDHLETRLRCSAEREFMRSLEGGCSVPLGVATLLKETSDDSQKSYSLELIGSVTSLDGRQQLKSSKTATLTGERKMMIEQAIALGNEVASKLKDDGAVAILNEIKTVPK